MVLAALQNLLCCCRHEPEPPNDGQEQFDETSHLIRHTIEPPVIRVDEEYERQQRHQERLANIVRNTSGRMVNLGARLPFNLRNQVLPASGSRSYSHSTTRSASPSNHNNDALDQLYHPSQNYYDVYTNEESAAKRPRHLNPYQPDHPSRSPSPNVGADVDADADKGPKIQVMATRLLGVRLVPHEEVRTRGRTAERSAQPSGHPVLSGIHTGSADAFEGRIVGVEEDEGEATPRPEPRKFDFKIPDVGPLTVDWD